MHRAILQELVEMSEGYKRLFFLTPLAGILNTITRKAMIDFGTRITSKKWFSLYRGENCRVTELCPSFIKHNKWNMDYNLKSKRFIYR
jgi:hypothetical protein